MTMTTKIRDYLGLPATIHANASLIDAGYLDSFRLMDLAAFLEDTFSIELSAGDFAADAVDTNFGTVTKIVAYLAHKGVT